MSSPIFRTLFQKSRLEEYSSLLDYALEHGYLLTSLSDWFEGSFFPGKKVMILRHDVDFNPEGAYKMFLIEKERQATATYYFRWSTAKKSVIQKISSNGFEVSLHYETLATYCKKHHINRPEEVTGQVLESCNEILVEELRNFEKRFGKVKTLCSHGDFWNMRTGIPNYKIIKDTSRDVLGIYFEAYDKDILSRFDSYLSDSSLMSGHKWKYNRTPEEAIESGVKAICLLTHPHHWDYHFIQNMKMLFIKLRLKIQEPLST
jgi:hypothetical protein